MNTLLLTFVEFLHIQSSLSIKRGGLFIIDLGTYLQYRYLSTTYLLTYSFVKTGLSGAKFHWGALEGECSSGRPKRLSEPGPGHKIKKDPTRG